MMYITELPNWKIFGVSLSSSKEITGNVEVGVWMMLIVRLFLIFIMMQIQSLSGDWENRPRSRPRLVYLGTLELIRTQPGCNKLVCKQEWIIFDSHMRTLETQQLGDMPVMINSKKIALNYQVAPLLVEQKPFDFYLSDGRYRVACACVGFLHAMKYGADLERVRVGIHDNDENWRRGYDVLLEIGHSVVKNRKLWVYKLKSGITEEQVFKLWLKYVDNSI
mmetsp:Transcript_15182/g.16838  ORF Transcript_15182/g.16838 Transcript_15182/m.16838 type:complete len:221 (-) Transcript_15182:38-700(-)